MFIQTNKFKNSRVQSWYKHITLLHIASCISCELLCRRWQIEADAAGKRANLFAQPLAQLKINSFELKWVCSFPSAATVPKTCTRSVRCISQRRSMNAIRGSGAFYKYKCRVRVSWHEGLFMFLFFACFSARPLKLVKAGENKQQ